MPTLDEAMMVATAGDAGGRYMRLQIDDSDLDYLLAEDPLLEPVESLAIDRSADTWEDQGYLLLIALIPLVLALFRRGWVVCVLPMLLLGSPDQAHADLWDDLWLTPDQQAMRALQQGDPEAAAGLFENSEWAGTASYQAGDYEGATEAFSQADTADSWYNRGNALARSGELEEAIKAYRESLERDPEREDALENIALLEQMQQQQQQQQQQGEQGDQQDQDEQSGDQQSEGEQENDQQQPEGAQQEGDDAPPSGDEGQPQQDAEQTDGDQAEQQPEERPEPGADNEEQADQARQSAEEDAGEEGAEEGEAQAAMSEVDPEQQERDQAMEQWLRRVPDDPSGLLREKFRYQSQQRQRDGSKQNAQVW